MIKLIQTFLQISSLFRSSQLVIKGSKFVPFCGHPSVDLGRQAFPHQKLWRRYDGHLCLSFNIHRYVLQRNILQSRSSCIEEVFLQEVAFWMDNGHPSEESHRLWWRQRQGQARRQLPPRGNSKCTVYHKCIKMLNRTVLSVVVLWSSCGSGLTDLYSASTGIGRSFCSSWDSPPSVRLSRSWAWLLETPRLCYNSIVI